MRAFTLVEILITIAIVSLLLAIMLPLLASMRGSARQFRCQIALRGASFDFALFADAQLAPDRGDDGQGRRFRLETFQESLYRIDEFWPREVEAMSRTVALGSPDDALRCAGVRGELVLWNGLPCSQGAVAPPEHVSYGFNARLHRPVVIGPGGQPSMPQLWLTDAILADPMIPLAWDVDGAVAQSRTLAPVFSAPALPSETVGLYADGSHWFPAMRHNGAASFAFIGGHVLTVPRPLEESNWIWAATITK